MKITIQYFGVIADITKVREEEIYFETSDITLHVLQAALEKRYPEIGTTLYSMAVNCSIAKEDVLLHNTDEIALLPPFAGG